MRPRLRIYTGEEDEQTTATLAEPTVSVRLSEISQVLADAVLSRRTWLSDFADEEVKISADLYEIISTYWNLRPSA